ncbi:esterase/lipase family protein [Psychromonas ossibalaenae]|uniref:esterase/lipase family protein n=1 Tax=Psychromonas ossibalaenae TaxID=444922 RepID=UPI00035CAB4E|nr:hypothetical protein [Psychromonas ossibalaenae]
MINCCYPSLKYSMEILAENTINQALQLCPESDKVHFVSHSMGGILIRLYLQKRHINNLGRVVMLGPPNQGSQLIDLLGRLIKNRHFNKQAGMQLGTEPDSFVNSIGGADFELGIIAGKRSVNPILSTLLPGQNDGKVAVHSTRLSGMKDHLVMPVTHPFMMKNNRVISQVKHFLQHGLFSRDELSVVRSI